MPELSARQNIVVIAGEAHRSQYGFSGEVNEKTREMPYGFAGTPIEKTNANPGAVLGADLLRKPDFQTHPERCWTGDVVAFPQHSKSASFPQSASFGFWLALVDRTGSV